MLVTNHSVYVFSLENQTWSEIKSATSISSEFNKLINVNGGVYLFKNIKIKKFNELTDKFITICWIGMELEGYGLCYLGSNEVIIAGGEQHHINEGWKTLGENIVRWLMWMAISTV